MADKKAESFGIRKYIRYVKQRSKLLQISCVNASDNQISYFNALSKSIDEYANTHKLYIKYIAGKLTFNELKAWIGESDRQAFRYLKRQRDLFVKYIQEKEIEYFAKYPFYDKAGLEE